jgi:hypothetical protein
MISSFRGYKWPGEISGLAPVYPTLHTLSDYYYLNMSCHSGYFQWSDTLRIPFVDYLSICVHLKINVRVEELTFHF